MLSAAGIMRSGVAGVQTPAFVERPASGDSIVPSPDAVSPEFRLRPSLSVAQAQVDRARTSMEVSPEFRLRPSLSVVDVDSVYREQSSRVCRRSSDSGLR